MQNDYFEDGPIGIQGASDIVGTINKLVQNSAFDLIVWVRDWHPTDHVSFCQNYSGIKPFSYIESVNGQQMMTWPRHCVQDTVGAMYNSSLICRPNDKEILLGSHKERESISSFSEEDYQPIGLNEML